METIGLLSGIGHLPVDVALSAKSMGYRVIAELLRQYNIMLKMIVGLHGYQH